jgi:hypothetical protein
MYQKPVSEQLENILADINTIIKSLEGKMARQIIKNTI